MPEHTEGHQGFEPAREGTLRLAPALSVPELLTRYGLDPAPIIAAAGLDPAAFGDPEQPIAFADMGRLLAVCAERTGNPCFGHEVGARAGIEALGLVGSLAAQAETVGAALEDVVRHLHLHDKGAVLAFWQSGERAALGYVIHVPGIAGIEHFYDGALAIATNTLKSLCGPRFAPLEVRLSRPEPADTEPYRRFYGVRPRFGAEQSEVVFAASWLRQPVAGADPLLRQALRAVIDDLEAQTAGSVAERLRRLLRRLLMAAQPGQPSLRHLAQQLALHERTLNRRLREQGTSFREVLDETRYEAARRLLRDTRLAIADIAASLDYADAAAFSRAFRRWSGTSPAAWRDTATGPPADPPLS